MFLRMVNRYQRTRPARWLKRHLPAAVQSFAASILRHREYKEARAIYRRLKTLHEQEGEELAESVRSFQRTKLLSLLRHAASSCPYYRRLFSSQGINVSDLESFEQIPRLTKETIRQNRADLVSDDARRGDYTLKTTAGSTGQPLEFPVSPLPGCVDRVHQQFHFEAMGYKRGDRIYAFDGLRVSPSCREQSVFWRRRGRQELPYGSMRYSCFDLSDDTAPAYVEHLLRNKPAFLRGYPSGITKIANFILENGVNAEGFLKGVQLTAESILPHQVDTIVRAFGTSVYGQYGHAEVSVFGYTLDESFTYFCSPFYGLTEVLDEQGAHVDTGEVGEIVVTGFYNSVMPFVRYRTSDFAVYGGRDCGVVKLSRIEGRGQDYLVTKDGRRICVTAIHFEDWNAFRKLREWQIRQYEPGQLEIHIIKGGRYSSTDEREIGDKFRQLGGFSVRFVYPEKIPLGGRSKRHLILSKVPGARSAR